MVYLWLVVRISSSYNDECYDNGDTIMGLKRTINRKEEEKLNDKKPLFDLKKNFKKTDTILVS